MAKSKRGKRKGTYRRRRVGAAGGMQAVAMKVAGIAAGVYAANLLKKTVTSLSPTIMGALEVGAGVMLPRFVKGNALVEGVADGLIAKGAIDLLTSTGVMAGLGSVPYINPYRAPGLLTNPGKLTKPIGGVDTTKDLMRMGTLFSN